MKSLWLALYLAPACAIADGCETFPAGYRVSAPLSIKQIEAESLADIRKSGNPEVPDVPFGFINAQWQQFKAALRDGDEIVRFSSTPEEWKDMRGQAGYARQRNGCIQATIITRVS